MKEEIMQNYYKSEWALLSVSYDILKREHKNLKTRYTNLHKKYCDLRLQYETLLYNLDLQKKKK